jgi:hypothetical protein
MKTIVKEVVGATQGKRAANTPSTPTPDMASPHEGAGVVPLVNWLISTYHNPITR